MLQLSLSPLRETSARKENEMRDLSGEDLEWEHSATTLLYPFLNVANNITNSRTSFSRSLLTRARISLSVGVYASK